MMREPQKHNSLKLRPLIVALLFACCFIQARAQTTPSVKASVDTTNIRIGEQINYLLEVQADQGNIVVFPEGQTFSPLEMIESYAIDTSFASAKMTLVKKYGLTQFDSGSYKIPSQKILVADRTLQTDTFRIEVANVVVDTVKQGLYDIKPLIELPKDYSNWWKYLLWIVPIAVAIGLFLFWLLRRHKKQKEAEKYIPPFEKALATLKSLDESDFIASAKYKEYYSVLTDAVRRYYEEKVYDRALESTTDELIERLEAERDSGHIDFSTEIIANLKDIFKRADLVKFARIHPPEGKALADRLAIEEIVKETKEVLPEPTLEELMKDHDYREAMDRKRKRKLWLTGIAGVAAILILATGIGIAIKGYNEVKDFILGNATRELAEGNWVTSEYGYPSLVISTPKVLERTPLPLPEELKGKAEITLFAWNTKQPAIAIAVSQMNLAEGQEFDVEQGVQGGLANMEQNGIKIKLVKNDKFTTPNGAEGLKTHGTAEFPIDAKKEKYVTAEYSMLTFTAETVVQQVIMYWRTDDTYSAQIAERVINSVELQKPEAQ